MRRKMLYVGEFLTPQYDGAMSLGFERLGCEVRRLTVSDFVNGSSFLKRLQRRVLNGPAFWGLWSGFFQQVQAMTPDIIYFRRPMEFPSWTLRRLRRIAPGACLVSYMNDDPFGPDRDRPWLRYYRQTIPLFDIHFTLRQLNIPEFARNGARRVEVLWPYYVSEMHHDDELAPGEEGELKCDCLFVGHGEADLRGDCFDALLAAGLDLRLGGSGFERLAQGRPHERLLPTRYIGGEVYRKAIRTATCSLCFFSRRNRDVLTTRVFEIPACGGVLVVERNSLMQELFNEGREAFFFSSPAELVQIVRRLKADPVLRRSVAEQGRKRVLAGKHEVLDRARQILAAVGSLDREVVTHA
jgi:spore maturation protein CgeB